METARVYRMKTAEHLCPFGMKTVDLLKRKGYQVDDIRSHPEMKLRHSRPRRMSIPPRKPISAINVLAVMKRCASI